MIKERTILGSDADGAASQATAISAGEAPEQVSEQQDGDAGEDDSVASDAGVGHVAGLLARQRLDEKGRPSDAGSSHPSHDSSSAAQTSSPLLPNHSRIRHPMQLEFWNFPGEC